MYIKSIIIKKIFPMIIIFFVKNITILELSILIRIKILFIFYASCNTRNLKNQNT